MGFRDWFRYNNNQSIDFFFLDRSAMDRRHLYPSVKNNWYKMSSAAALEDSLRLRCTIPTSSIHFVEGEEPALFPDPRTAQERFLLFSRRIS